MLSSGLGKATMLPAPSATPARSYSRSQLPGCTAEDKEKGQLLLLVHSFTKQSLNIYLVQGFLVEHWRDMDQDRHVLFILTFGDGGRENVPDKPVNRQMNNYFPIMIEIMKLADWVQRSRENMGEELIWNELFKLNFSEQVTFKQSPGGRKGASHAGVKCLLGRRVPAQGTTWGKTLKQERTCNDVQSQIIMEFASSPW